MQSIYYCVLYIAGAVFQDPDTYSHVAFKYALLMYNSDPDTMFRVSVTIKPVAQTTDAYTFLTGGKFSL